MFWDNFVSMCNIHKVSPNGVAKQLGFSTGTVTWWKKGRIPRDTALKKIADFFGVTPKYLLGETDNREKPEEKTPSKLWEGEEMSDKEKQMFVKFAATPELSTVRVSSVCPQVVRIGTVKEMLLTSVSAVATELLAVPPGTVIPFC